MLAMIRHFSAGGIVFKKEGDNTHFLLIENSSIKYPDRKYWGFPKGHLEEAESTKDAAIREVAEETGVEAEIIEKVTDSKYMFTDSSGEKIFKVVTFYLMEYKSGELNRQLEEVSDLGWFTESETLEKISFFKDRALFKHALEMLNG